MAIENKFSIYELSEDTQVTVDCGAAGVWYGQMLKGSPLRMLLEHQQGYQNKWEEDKKVVASGE